MVLTIPVILELIAFIITEAPVVWNEIASLVAIGQKIQAGHPTSDDEQMLAAAVAARKANQAKS